jgi:hypothetical protein
MDPPKPKTPEIHEPSIDTTEKTLEPIVRRPETGQSALNTSIYDIQWITPILDQTLSESPRDVTYDKDYEFLKHITSILRQIRANGELSIQTTIDVVYSEVVTLVQPRKSRARKNPKPTKGVREKHIKRRRKLYLYGRYQALYNKNSGLPVKYIRKGTDWLEDPVDTLNATEIQTFDVCMS